MKLAKILGLILLLAVFINNASALPWDTPTTVTWFMKSDTHTVNTELGYVLNETQGTSSTSLSDDVSGDLNVYLGWRIWVVRASGSASEISSGTPVAQVNRSSDGEGFQNATWTPSAETSVYYGADALKVMAYLKFDSGDWVGLVTFMTEQIPTDKLLNNVAWVFRVYTKREYSGGFTRMWLYWGDLTYQSRIENVQYDTLKPWETMTHRFGTGDFVLAIVTPWVYFIGNLFYGIIMLFFAVTTYNKYGSIKPVLVLFWLLGGAGGVLTLLIPAIGLYAAWFFLAFALASTLFVLFR